MSEINSSMPDVVARAEAFLNSDLIKARRCGPVPKREGIGRTCGKGRAFEWLCQHVSYDEKKCLFWPFSKCRGRAGTIGYRGRSFKPVRLMCLLAHGEPPTNKHRAAHTCGRGHNGCINPKHLTWKTPSECMHDEFRDGRWIAYGKGGKITPAEAAEIRALGGTKTATAIGEIYGLSGQRIGEILRGTAHVTPRTFSPKNGKFYPRITVDKHVYYLGVFSSAEKAATAYEAARIRARLGEPIRPPKREKPTFTDIRRWYSPPSQKVQFGDREGELVLAIEAEQEQSTFLMHHALNRLSPKARALLISVKETGDLRASADAIGLSMSEVAELLPVLRRFLCPDEDSASPLLAA